jgi:pyrroloquinoline quinone biosynthesis protein B
MGQFDLRSLVLFHTFGKVKQRQMPYFLRTITLCIFFIIVDFCTACTSQNDENERHTEPVKDSILLMVLGVSQDAGYPQIGCEKKCCVAFYEGRETKKHVTSLALMDGKTGEYWLLEATPDIAAQLHKVQEQRPTRSFQMPSGIFLTHAHMGHYSGLVHFGKEAFGAKSVKVYGMPRMNTFLRDNGPWSQLITMRNIELITLKDDSTIRFNNGLSIQPIRVPHRDEYSETVGFRISTDHKKVLFIPDIDKWERWDHSILNEIRSVDLALLDGTFFDIGELPGRDMKEIPHPFVSESMKLFQALPDSVRAKIMFIHFNHTNPLLLFKSPEKDSVRAKGFRIAEEGMKIVL